MAYAILTEADSSNLAGDDGSTVLAQVIYSGEYLSFTKEQEQRFEREPHLIEADMRQHYKNALISTILKSQMCYIECSSDKSSQSDKSSFEPEEGKFCSAKCWQNWTGEKELKLFGLDDISKPDNEWAIQTQAFLKASYDHYKANGFRADEMLPSVEDLIEDEVTPNTGSFLPVCDSWLPHKVHGNSGIPCICGDQYGSKTAAFWEAANFDSWKAADLGEFPLLEHKYGPPFLCANDMSIQRISPVDYFLNMCNMDWRWPTKRDENRLPLKIWNDDSFQYLQKGADVLCKPFKEEMDSFIESGEYRELDPDRKKRGLDCFMCERSKIGKVIKGGYDESQRDWIKDMFVDFPAWPSPHTEYNFKRACQERAEDLGKC
ncbi:MAG: hypothetical protein Q9172_000580 [Xanthocarpia lactea]